MKITDLPYSERRVVVIRPSSDGDPVASSVDWEKVVGLGAGVVGAGGAVGAASSALSAVALGLGSTVLAPVAIGGLVYWLGKKFISSDGDPTKQRSLSGVLAVDYVTAKGQLLFPPGHPMPENAYVGHPLVGARYVPYASFHPVLFEEKVNELVTLLASLGATRVKVACRKGYRRAAGCDADISGPRGSAKVGLGASGKQSSTEEAVFEEHFRPSGSPFVPDDLVWLDHEASWQALAQRRLKFGTSKFQVALRYQDDFGVNAKFKAGLEGVGLKCGGNFSEFESTEWDFEGEFV